MKNWTIGKRITFGFASVIVVSMALGIFAYSRLMVIRTWSEAIVGDALPGVYCIAQVESNVRQGQVLLYKHLLSETKEEAAQYDIEIAALAQMNEKALADYEKTITRAKDRELFEQIKALYSPFLQSRQEVLKLSRELKKKEAFELAKAQLKPAYDKVEEAIDAEVKFNKDSGDEFSKAIQTAIGAAQTASG